MRNWRQTVRRYYRARYTVMVVPHSGGTSFRVNIPLVGITLVVIFCLIAATMTLSGITAYKTLAKKVTKLSVLEKASVNYKRTLSKAKSQNELQKQQIKAAVQRDQALIRKVNRLLGGGGSIGTVSRGLTRPRTPGVTPQTAKSIGAQNTRGSTTKLALSTLIHQLENQEAILKRLCSALQEHQEMLLCKPTGWPIYGGITSPFGSRRLFQQSEFHPGIDIEASYGDRVRVTGAGVVIFAGWKSGYGLLVEVSHGYGFRTYYGHNSKLLVKVGERVKRGESIARAGSTGRSTGTHVHYEIHLDGHLVNPRPYLS